MGVEGIIKEVFFCVRAFAGFQFQSLDLPANFAAPPPPKKKLSHLLFFLPRKAVIIVVDDELLLHLFVGTP